MYSRSAQRPLGGSSLWGAFPKPSVPGGFAPVRSQKSGREGCASAVNCRQFASVPSRNVTTTRPTHAALPRDSTLPVAMPPEPEPPLDEALYASAVRFAGSSVQAFAAEDDAVFLLHAGTALEHLAKSLLASLHGSLIAISNPRQFGSLLFLAGFEKESGIKGSQMRTVSMEEALSRAGHLVPPLANLKAPLQPLVDGRNSVAHAALADRITAESSLVPFLRACDLLLSKMERDRAAFWGDMLDVVDARETESAEAATIAALEKIAAAKAAFAALVGNLGDDARNGLVLAIANG
jgi:hypothetical protein